MVRSFTRVGDDGKVVPNFWIGSNDKDVINCHLTCGKYSAFGFVVGFPGVDAPIALNPHRHGSTHGRF